MINLSKKTFKREYAAARFFVLLYQIMFGDKEMVEVIIWPIMSYIATAAGLHIYGQNTTNQRQSNGET